MSTKRVAVGTVTCLVAVALATGDGWAAASPALKASRNCRKAIGSAFGKVSTTALGVIGRCHKGRDKGKFPGDCNDITQADVKGKVAGAETKARAAIDKKCLAGEAVLHNYDQSNPAGVFLPFAETTIATTSTSVLGAPQIVGDKAKVKCHAAIVKAEISDIAEILKAATKCQNAEDKLADTFGALECVATAVKSGPKGEAAITKVCGDKQITGADVDSCEPLPGCVTQAATASAQALAAAIYGQVPTPTPTPTSTQTPKFTPTPTVTSTPKPMCESGDKVTVVALLDKTYGSATITLVYPEAVIIPGQAQSQAVKDRVAFTPAGLQTASDDDLIPSGGDGLDDTLTASLAGFGDSPPGTFVTATFDCVSGMATPTASEFVCGASASTTGGELIPDVHCTIEVH
jgi:hypothetical protein